jgi:tripartite-type tricarboxylate transporter receptor subunit TctC
MDGLFPQSKRSALWLALAAGAALPQIASGAEGTYPYRPIRIIQGFTVGGVSDTLARTIGEKLGERVGQTVVVEPRQGAGGVLAMEAAAQSSPDGYTLLMGTATITISPNFKQKLAFDPMKSYVPIALLGTAPSILLANPAVPVKSIGELIAYARARPGQINVSTSGVGTTNDLAVHLLNYMTGTKMVTVPYKGSAATLTATIAGETPLNFGPLLPAIPLVQAGRLKALGVTTLKRTPAVPDVPAIAETVPNFEAVSWYGIVAPLKTSPAIVRRLNAEINAVLALPEVAKRLASQGVDVESMSPQQFTEYIKTDAARWKELFERTGLML